MAGRSRIQVFVHLVWATWDRLPLMTPAVERDAHRLLVSEAANLGCTVVAIGGTEDHVHLLIGVPSTVSISEIVKQIKGVSSKALNEDRDAFFKWQGYYGAFSVSRWDVVRIKSYILNQKGRHGSGSVVAELEETRFETEDSVNT